LSERILKYLRELCTGCGICVEVCPKDCIQLNPPSAKNTHPLIIIDSNECHLCGICCEVCLFNAIDVHVNGQSIKKFEGTPHYSPTYEMDQSKCKPDCKECEIACPRGAIKIKSNNGVFVERDESKCVYCTSCALACPEDAIVVEKVFSGEISIDENCQACGVCVELCPTNAIVLPKFELDREVERIKVIEEKCIYCGACEKACPLNLITVLRRNVNYSVTGMSSWTKTHEEAFRNIITR
jgi:4Fe-4S ferredoxin